MILLGGLQGLATLGRNCSRFRFCDVHSDDLLKMALKSDQVAIGYRNRLRAPPHALSLKVHLLPRELLASFACHQGTPFGGNAHE